MTKVGVVGYGYWGPNLVRNFAETKGAEMTAVCDASGDRLAAAKARYPGIEAFTDYDKMIAEAGLDAVVVATPVSSHFALGMKALEGGKHLLMEKPIAASSGEAVQLMEEAERRGLVLLVDHTFVYTGAIRKMQELVSGGEIGDVYYYDSVRINLGLFQHDVNVLWDLAVHDLSIMDAVLPASPCAVSATGMSHFTGQPENVSYLTLFFEGPLIAHIHVNWLAPAKVRRTLVGGSRKMIVYDDLDPSEKVKVYDKGVTMNESTESESIYKMLIGYRTGDMWAPQIDMTEALRAETRHFIDCIEGKDKPITDGKTGLRVVKILEAAEESIRQRGKPVDVPSG